MQQESAGKKKQEPGKKKQSLGDRIIRAGAIVAALVTIVAFARQLWPDPPPRLAGELANITVIADVTLAEFTERQKFGSVEGPERASRQKLLTGGQLRLVNVSAQESPSPTPTPSPDPTSSPTPLPSPTPEVLECPICPDRVAIQFDEVQTKLPDEGLLGCEYTRRAKMDCEDAAVLRSITAPGTVSVEDGVATTSSASLLEVLNRTRERQVSAGVTEPLGVVISFDLTLEGYEKRKIDVRWSLFRGDKRAKVPRDWLVNRRALVAQPKAAFDRASGEFWIPLPKRTGPYFVRLSAWDEKTRIDFTDSTPFD
ncbi:MAG: hypothetical protein ACRDK3_01885 [Actinomycetota bacterium]